MIFKNFFRKQDNEDFFCLRKYRSGLSVNLFIDDIGTWYNKKEHCYFLKFQNNINDLPDYKNAIAVTITDKPKILCKNHIKKLLSKLNNDDISHIKQFIIENKSILIKISKQEIDYLDFFQNK